MAPAKFFFKADMEYSFLNSYDGSLTNVQNGDDDMC